MTTLIVDAQWAEKNAGDVVSYNGKEYTIGTDAFASLDAALIAASADVNVTTIEIASDITEEATSNYTFGHDVAIKAPSAVKVTFTNAPVFYIENSTLTWDENIDLATPHFSPGYNYSNGNIVFNGNVEFSTIVNYAGSSSMTISEGAEVSGSSITGYGTDFKIDITGQLTDTKDVTLSSAAKSLSASYVQLEDWYTGDPGVRTFNMTNAYVELTTGLYHFETSELAVSLTNSALVVSGEGVVMEGSNGGVFALNSGSRLKASAVALVNGYTLDVNGSSVEVAGTISNKGAITLDIASTLKADAITGDGTITIDAAGFTEGTLKIIDLTNNSPLKGKVEIINLAEGVNVRYGADGDVTLTDQSVSVVYVDKAWADTAEGTILGEDKEFGVTAFADLKSAVAAADSGATIVLLNSGDVDANDVDIVGKDLTLDGENVNLVSSRVDFQNTTVVLTKDMTLTQNGVAAGAPFGYSKAVGTVFDLGGKELKINGMMVFEYSTIKNGTLTINSNAGVNTNGGITICFQADWTTGAKDGTGPNNKITIAADATFHVTETSGLTIYANTDVYGKLINESTVGNNTIIGNADSWGETPNGVTVKVSGTGAEFVNTTRGLTIYGESKNATPDFKLLVEDGGKATLGTVTNAGAIEVNDATLSAKSISNTASASVAVTGASKIAFDTFTATTNVRFGNVEDHSKITVGSVSGNGASITDHRIDFVNTDVTLADDLTLNVDKNSTASAAQIKIWEGKVDLEGHTLYANGHFTVGDAGQGVKFEDGRVEVNAMDGKAGWNNVCFQYYGHEVGEDVEFVVTDTAAFNVYGDTTVYGTVTVNHNATGYDNVGGGFDEEGLAAGSHFKISGENASFTVTRADSTQQYMYRIWGAMSKSGAGVLTVENGAVFDVQGAVYNYSEVNINNAELFKAASLENTGTITIKGSDFVVNDLKNTGSITINAGAMVSINNKLTGTGTITIDLTGGSMYDKKIIDLADDANVDYSQIVSNWDEVKDLVQVVDNDLIVKGKKNAETKTWVLENVDDFKAFRDEVNAGNNFAGWTVTLAADIDLNNEEWTPIGTSSTPFNGVFDGGNHTISNLKITGNKSNAGLFGRTNNGEVKNFTLHNAYVTGDLNVGAVAGTPYTTKYTNITLSGDVYVAGFSYVGGMLGKNAYANLTDLTINANEGSLVKAESENYRTYVGGVVGFMGEGGHTLTNINSNINVEGSTCDIGGIVGIAHYGNNFVNVNCTADSIKVTNGDVDAYKEIGGIAGVWYNEKGQNVTFENCTVGGNTNISAIVGGEDKSADVAGNTLTGAAYHAGNVGDASGDLQITQTSGYYDILADTTWNNVNFTGNVSVGFNKYAVPGLTLTLGKDVNVAGYIYVGDKTGTDQKYESGDQHYLKIADGNTATLSGLNVRVTGNLSVTGKATLYVTSDACLNGTVLVDNGYLLTNHASIYRNASVSVTNNGVFRHGYIYEGDGADIGATVSVTDNSIYAADGWYLQGGVKITVDASSQVLLSRLRNNDPAGENFITIDTTGFVGYTKVIDMFADYDNATKQVVNSSYTGTVDAADYEKMIANWDEIKDMAVVKDGDLYIQNVDTSKLYVNSDYAGKGYVYGQEVAEGRFYGINAFGSYNEVIEVAKNLYMSTATVVEHDGKLYAIKAGTRLTGEVIIEKGKFYLSNEHASQSNGNVIVTYKADSNGNLLDKDGNLLQPGQNPVVNSKTGGLTGLKVTVMAGAAIYSQQSKLDMNFQVTVKPGGTLATDRANTNTHVMTTLIVGEDGSDVRSTVNFISDIQLRSGKCEIYSADLNCSDFESRVGVTVKNSTLKVNGAFCSSTWSAFNLTDSSLTIVGKQISGGMSDFQEKNYNNRLAKMTLTRSTVAVTDKSATVSVQNVTLVDSTLSVGMLNMTGNITMDMASTLSFANIALTSGKKIIISDIADYQGGAFKLFDYTGNEAFVEDYYRAMLGDVWNDNYKVIGNDLFLNDSSDVYVNADYVGKEFGEEIAEGKYVGVNAFGSLKDAVDAVVDGGKITVEGDKVIDGDDAYISGKNITLAGKGTIYNDSGWIRIAKDGDSTVTVAEGSDIVIRSSSGDHAINVSGLELNADGTTHRYNGKLVVDNAHLFADYVIDRGIVEVKGDGTAYADKANMSANHFGVASEGVNTAELNLTDKAYFKMAGNAALNVTETGEVNVNDSKLEGDIVNAGEVNVTDSGLVAGDVNNVGVFNVDGGTVTGESFVNNSKLVLSGFTAGAKREIVLQITLEGDEGTIQKSVTIEKNKTSITLYFDDLVDGRYTITSLDVAETDPFNMMKTSQQMVHNGEFYVNNGVIDIAELNVGKGTALVSGESKLTVDTLKGTLKVADGTTLVDSNVGGTVRLLGDLTVDGGLTANAVYSYGSADAPIDVEINGDKITGGHGLFYRGNFVYNADMEYGYVYFSYDGTHTVNSDIVATNTPNQSDAAIWVNGALTVAYGGSMDATQGNIILHDADASITVLEGGLVNVANNLTWYTSGGKLTVDGGEVNVDKNISAHKATVGDIAVLNGGILTVGGTINNAGSMTVSDATVDVDTIVNGEDASVTVSGESKLTIGSVNGGVSVADGTTLVDSNVGGTVLLLGDLDVEGGLTADAVYSYGSADAPIDVEINGDKIIGGHGLFYRGNFVYNADMEYGYVYFSYDGTHTVNSAVVATTKQVDAAFFINGDVTVVNGASLTATNGNILFNNGSDAKLTIEEGATVTAAGNVGSWYDAGIGAIINIDGTLSAKSIANKGAITISTTGLLQAQTITGDGTITIDATGFIGFKRVIDLSGTESLAGKVNFTNLAENVKVIYGADGDVSLTTASTDIVYANNAWEGSTYGQEVAPGRFYNYNAFDSLQGAVAAANKGGTVNVEGTLTSNVAISNGQNLTVTGTASFDWSKGFFFIGRGVEGADRDVLTVVTFDNAQITSVSDSDAYGFHVSGYDRASSSTNYGQLDIVNGSNIQLDYLINRNVVNVDNSYLIVANGFDIHGRPASESKSGADETAYLNISNGAVVEVDNENGMGTGREGKGVINIDNATLRYLKGTLHNRAKGTINMSNNALLDVINGTIDNSGTLTVDDATVKAGKVVNSGSLNIYTDNFNADSVENSGMMYVLDAKLTDQNITGNGYLVANDSVLKNNSINGQASYLVGVEIDGGSFAGTGEVYTGYGWVNDAWDSDRASTTVIKGKVDASDKTWGNYGKMVVEDGAEWSVDYYHGGSELNTFKSGSVVEAGIFQLYNGLVEAGANVNADAAVQLYGRDGGAQVDINGVVTVKHDEAMAVNLYVGFDTINQGSWVIGGADTVVNVSGAGAKLQALEGDAGKATAVVNKDDIGKAAQLNITDNAEMVVEGTLQVKGGVLLDNASMNVEELTNSGVIDIVNGADARFDYVYNSGSITLDNASLTVDGILEFKKGYTATPGGWINMDIFSTITAEEIDPNGFGNYHGFNITVTDADLAALDPDTKLIKLIEQTDDSASDVSRNIFLNGNRLASRDLEAAEIGDYSIVSIENDVYLVKGNRDEFYIGDIYADMDYGTVAGDGMIVGFNTFGSMTEVEQLLGNTRSTFTINVMSDADFVMNGNAYYQTFKFVNGSDSTVTVDIVNNLTDAPKRYFGEFEIGEGVTLKQDASIFYATKGGVIAGTLDVNYYYQGGDIGDPRKTVTIEETGKLISGGDALQVKGETGLIVKGEIESTSSVQVWNADSLPGDAKLEVIGGKVTADGLKMWGGDGSQTTIISDGGKVNVRVFEADQTSQVTVTGEGSELNVSGSGAVGAARPSTGYLYVKDGASASFGSLTVGKDGEVYLTNATLTTDTLTNTGAAFEVTDSTLKVNKLDNDAAMFLSGTNTIQVEDATGSDFAIRANDGVTLNNSYIKAGGNETLRMLGSMTVNGGLQVAYLQGSSAGVGGTLTIKDDTVINASYGVEFSKDYVLNGGKIVLSGGNASGKVWGFVFQDGTFTINTDVEVIGGGATAPIHFTNATATVNSTITQKSSGGEVIYLSDSAVTIGKNGVMGSETGVFVNDGSTLTVAGAVNGKSLKVNAADAKLIMNGGTVDTANKIANAGSIIINGDDSEIADEITGEGLFQVANGEFTTSAAITAGKLVVGKSGGETQFNEIEASDSGAVLNLKHNLTITGTKDDETKIWVGYGRDEDNLLANQGKFVLNISDGVTVKSNSFCVENAGVVNVSENAYLDVHYTKIRGVMTVTDSTLIADSRMNVYGEEIFNDANEQVVGKAVFTATNSKVEVSADLIVGKENNEYRVGSFIANNSTVKANSLVVNTASDMTFNDGSMTVTTTAVNNGTINVDNAVFTAASVTNNGELNVSGTSTVNVGEMVGNITAADGTVLVDSNIGGNKGLIYNEGAITFRGKNTINMIYGHGYYTTGDESITQSITVEKGASLYFNGGSSSTRLGLGCGEQIYVYGEFADGSAKAMDYTNMAADSASFSIDGIQLKNFGYDWDCGITVKDAYAVLSRGGGFTTSGDKGGDYILDFSNSVVEISHVYFYEDQPAVKMSLDGSVLYVKGYFYNYGTENVITAENGSVINLGYATSNAGSMTVTSGSELITVRLNASNKGSFTNTGDIELSDNAKWNAYSLENSGVITVSNSTIDVGDTIVNTGTINVDSATLSVGEFTNNGTLKLTWGENYNFTVENFDGAAGQITLDLSGVTDSVVKVVDASATGTVDYGTVTVNGYNTFVLDNDLMATTADRNTIYVNSAYTSQAAVGSYVYGYNAFASVADAVASTNSTDTTKIVVDGGMLSGRSYFGGYTAEILDGTTLADGGYICGGSASAAVNGVNLTITNLKGKDTGFIWASSGDVNGDVHMTINQAANTQLLGGAGGIWGGSWDGTVTGNIYLTVNGTGVDAAYNVYDDVSSWGKLGRVNGRLVGGGFGSLVDGDIALKASNVQFNQRIIGGGESGDVIGNVNVDIDNVRANYGIVGGGKGGNVTGDVVVDAKQFIFANAAKDSGSGGSERGWIIGGGWDGNVDGNVTMNLDQVKAVIDFNGGENGQNQSTIIAGGYKGDVTGNVTMNLNDVKAELIYGAGFDGKVGGDVDLKFNDVTASEIYVAGSNSTITGALNSEFSGKVSAEKVLDFGNGTAEIVAGAEVTAGEMKNAGKVNVTNATVNADKIANNGDIKITGDSMVNAKLEGSSAVVIDDAKLAGNIDVAWREDELKDGKVAVHTGSLVITGTTELNGTINNVVHTYGSGNPIGESDSPSAGMEFWAPYQNQANGGKILIGSEGKAANVTLNGTLTGVKTSVLNGSMTVSDTGAIYGTQAGDLSWRNVNVYSGYNFALGDYIVYGSADNFDVTFDGTNPIAEMTLESGAEMARFGHILIGSRQHDKGDNAYVFNVEQGATIKEFKQVTTRGDGTLNIAGTVSSYTTKSYCGSVEQANDGGFINNNGIINVSATGLLEIDSMNIGRKPEYGNAELNIDGGKVMFTNNMTVGYDASGRTGELNITNGGSLISEATSYTLQNGSEGSIKTVEKTAGTLTVGVAANGVVKVENGTVSVGNVNIGSKGSISVDNAVFTAATVANNGVFSVSGSSTLNGTFTGNSIKFAENTVLTSTSGAVFESNYTVGKMTFASGNFTFNQLYFDDVTLKSGAVVKVNGTFAMWDGESININAGAEVIANSIYFNGGSMVINGTVSSLQGGGDGGLILNGAGDTITVNSGAEVNVTYVDAYKTSADSIVDLYGTANVSFKLSDGSGKFTWNIYEGAELNAVKYGIVMNNAESVINIDALATLTGTTFTGNGSFVIDAEGFTGTRKVIDLAGNQSLRGKVTIKNAEDGVYAIYGDDGDVILTNTDTSTIYISTAYDDIAAGTIVDGKMVGANAFESLTDIGANSNGTLTLNSATNKIVLTAGNTVSYGNLKPGQAVTIETEGNGYALVDRILSEYLTPSEMVIAEGAKIYVNGTGKTSGANSDCPMTINGELKVGTAGSGFYVWSRGELVINKGGILTLEDGKFQNSGTMTVYGTMNIGKGGWTPKLAGNETGTVGHLIVDGKDGEGVLSVNNVQLAFGGGHCSVGWKDAGEGCTVTVQNGGKITSSAASFRNGVNSTMTLNNGTLEFTSVINESIGGNYFDNKGVIKASNGSVIDMTDRAFTNDGTITLDNTSMISAAFVNSASGTISMDVDSVIKFTEFTNAGTITIDLTDESKVNAAAGSVLLDRNDAGWTLDNYKSLFGANWTADMDKYLTVNANGDLAIKSSVVVYVNSDYTDADLTDGDKFRTHDEALASGAIKVITVGGTVAGNIEHDGAEGIINSGTFNGTVSGGAITASDKKDWDDREGSTMLTVNGGTFIKMFIGGDRVNVGNTERIGDINTVINGGTFKATVVGGMVYADKSLHGQAILTGDVNLKIAGGTFAKNIYGGSNAASEAYSTRSVIDGNVNIVVDASSNQIAFAANSTLVAGSYREGAIGGNTHVTFTGLASNITFGDNFEVWGGSSGDIYVINGDTRTFQSSVSGDRIFTFNGFSGEISSSIRGFNVMEVVGGSDVDLLSGNFKDIEVWNFETGSMLGGTFTNDFSGDTLNIDLGDWTGSSAVLMDGAESMFGGFESLTSVKIGGTALTLNGDVWSGAGYELKLESDEDSTMLTLNKLA